MTCCEAERVFLPTLVRPDLGSMFLRDQLVSDHEIPPAVLNVSMDAENIGRAEMIAYPLIKGEGRRIYPLEITLQVAEFFRSIDLAEAIEGIEVSTIGVQEARIGVTGLLCAIQFIEDTAEHEERFLPPRLMLQRLLKRLFRAFIISLSLKDSAIGQIGRCLVLAARKRFFEHLAALLIGTELEIGASQSHARFEVAGVVDGRFGECGQL